MPSHPNSTSVRIDTDQLERIRAVAGLVSTAAWLRDVIERELAAIEKTGEAS